MFQQSSLLTITSALFIALACASGCGDDSSTGDDAADPTSGGVADTDDGPTPLPPPGSTGEPGSTGSPGESSSDSAAESTGSAACGPTQLCSRTINECEIELTQAQCEGWYGDPAQHMCADIDGYTSCNCGCVEEPTCKDYFDCGMLCFEDFC